jgi:hypothetical protein
MERQKKREIGGALALGSRHSIKRHNNQPSVNGRDTGDWRGGVTGLDCVGGVVPSFAFGATKWNNNKKQRNGRGLGLGGCRSMIFHTTTNQK